MPALAQNVRLGLRSLRRAPGFTATAVVALALGIGLATAVFSVAEAMLLRRLPTLGVVVVSLLLVSLLASFVPARASTRVQPASALRAE